ncbi:MAG: ATP-binding cassette domain-containing protein [Bacteroidales bacterium]|nr:ATP-binding cassette domain-containing protein [Bacteroidales bacterium]
MSESIINALVHLFAIISNFSDVSISDKARDIVKSFLQKQLNTAQYHEYLRVFENYLEFYQRDKSSSVKGRKRGALSSVRVLKIAQQINENLQQKDKFIVLLRLIEFVNEDNFISESELDFITTVAESFNISQEEFEHIKALVTNDLSNIKNKQAFLIISGNNPETESDGLWFDENNPKKEDSFRYLENENLEGEIVVLRIESHDVYFFNYHGKSILYLHGQNIIPYTGYVLDHGSIIKGPKISPVYYSDIVGIFLQSPTQAKIIFRADEISFHFKNSKNGVQKFSFVEESGQMIGIMGGSGVGKSTLLSVLNGKIKIDEGKITINGYDIHQDKEELKGVIGYIPQDDLLIEELTVYQNLYFNTQLCFSDFSKDKIKATVEKTLKDINLWEIKDLQVGNPLKKTISGGQRKRLNIALELIREPSTLFVDEPTSGLSSHDSEMVMLLLRQQATKGKLIIVNIHQPSSDIFKLFDKLWVMDKYGYVIYQGNPIESITYFKRIINHINAEENECPTCGNVNPEQILEIVEEKVVDEYGHFTNIRKKTPEEWYALSKEILAPIKKESLKKGNLPKNQFKIPGILKQFQIFSLRNIMAKLTNRQYLLINFLEAPLLAVILAFFTKYLVNGNYIFADNKNLPVYLFMSIVVALFTGLTVSAQEIIKDRNILERESFLELSHFSYINSKIAVLFIMSAIQVLSYIIIGNWILHINGMVFSYWLILFSTAAMANLIGLNISAALNSVVNIYILIPFILVPQLLLGGAMVKFEDLHDSITSKKYVPLIGDLMVSRWAYETIAVEQFKKNKFEKLFFEEEKAKSRYTYKSAYWASEIDTRLSRVLLQVKQNKLQNIEYTIRLINHELQKISKSKEIKNIAVPVLTGIEKKELLFESAKDVKSYLDSIKTIFNKLAIEAGYKKDEKFKKLVKKIGKDAVYRLQLENHNKSLSDIVLNKMEMKKIIEVDGEFIQKKDPVFMEPVSNFGRAQFYVSEKRFLGHTFDTFWFNITVIWIGCFILYLALLGNWLKKLLDLSGNIKFKTAHKHKK